MQLTDALLDLCKESPRPLIAIDGRAGAGKTTFAALLKTRLSPHFSIETIHLDNLYNGWESAFDRHLTDSLLSAISAHQSGEEIVLRHFDWAKNCFGDEVRYQQSQLLIIEGVGALQQILLPHFTASIWIDIDLQEGRDRVIARDGDVSEPFIDNWVRLQERLFKEENSREAADFILALEI
jgi:uridine kinase